MKKEQLLGPLREIAFALGVALATFGVASQENVELVSGILLSIVTLIFSIRANEGAESIMTLFRKILSGAAGGLVAAGKMSPDKAEALVGLALVLVSSAWSFRAKGGGSPGGLPLWAVAMLALCLLPSCQIAFDPSTGRFGVATDPVAVTELVNRINDRLNEELEEVPPIAAPVEPEK